jgi:hypothetical protein
MSAVQNLKVIFIASSGAMILIALVVWVGNKLGVWLG